MNDDLSYDVKAAIQRAVLFHPLFEGTAADALEIAIAAIKEGDEIRASSPAQEPVTTEPVAWRYQRKEWDALLWRYQTEALVNDDFETPSNWLIEPLYAIPAPPQPGRKAIIEECAKVAESFRRQMLPGDDQILIRKIEDAIRALIGDPK